MTFPVLASICVLNKPSGHSREVVIDAAADVVGFAFSVTADKPLHEAGVIRGQIAEAVSALVDRALRVGGVGYSLSHRPSREVWRQKIASAIEAHKSPRPDYFSQ